MDQPKSKIVCFGEILWDLLPIGKVAGGAPMNVAYHANQMGITAQMISKIGQDELGKELLDFLNKKGVDTSLVQIDNTYPTGAVNVTLDALGSPSYEIMAPVAWDYINASTTDKVAVQQADAFVFGSLSARDDRTRETLFELLELAKLKVFDVNLRSPFYSKGLVTQLLHQADLVKMNDEELEVIGNWLGLNDTEENTALEIKKHFGWKQLIVTRGAKGAWLFSEDKMIISEGVEIQVQDTIGSGDAFLAAYLSKFLEGELPEKCLQIASATGAYVATQSGGTPEFTEDQIWKLTKNSLSKRIEMKLNNNNLSKIKSHIPVPTYDRKQLKTGIVHIGVGGFHRSHQAYYIHQLLQKGGAKDWAICGVGLREADRNMANVLTKQDGLYTLVTQYPNGKAESEVIGSIMEYLLAVDDPQLVIDKMAHPDTKIVTLTITEGGYNFNPITGDFNFEKPDIQDELVNPKEPKTVYGYITAALRIRRKQGSLPFTILSCDNIQHNGDMARKMLLTFAKRQNTELAEWIEKEVDFPNSMVDRITPVTTPKIIGLVNSKYHYTDKWPVVCEPYIQWVIEDSFVNGRPPLEEVGVQFVSDVTSYEKMKIRLLNAGHSVLGIPGALHGHKTINACMEDNLFALFMRQFMDKEATPILGKIEGIDLTKYKDNLEERFSNPNIKDGINRICSESSAKLPKFLIPTIKENLAIGGSVKYGIFILAAWCYYSDKAIDIQNSPIDISDERKEELNQRARQSDQDKFSFLRIPDIFGNLLENERFLNHYSNMIEAIYKNPNIHKLMELINQDNYLVE